MSMLTGALLIAGVALLIAIGLIVWDRYHHKREDQGEHYGDD